MSEKTCGTCQLAVEKYGDLTGTQLICRATAGHLRLAEDECDLYESDFETLLHRPKGGRMSELKTCPFCGGEAEVEKSGGGVFETWYVNCLICCASVWENAEAAAIEAWNRRANDA